jgi:hypothetical protein
MVRGDVEAVGVLRSGGSLAAAAGVRALAGAGAGCSTVAEGAVAAVWEVGVCGPKFLTR